MVNSMRKWVRLELPLRVEIEWNATLLEGDLETSIPKLKQEVDGDLFVHGSGEFAPRWPKPGWWTCLEIYVNPIVWGEGNVHVLGDRGDREDELDDVKRFDSSGVVLLRYLGGGALKASAASRIPSPLPGRSAWRAWQVAAR